MITEHERPAFAIHRPAFLRGLADWLREWKLFSLGIALGAFLICVTIAAPLIAPYPPAEVDYPHRLEGPSAAHWFGTDEHGRDILSRVIYGGRISIAIGAVSVLLATTIGLPWGLSIGFIGGRYDMISSRIIDAAFSIPSLLMSLSVITVMGRSEKSAMVAIAISRIPVIARVARAAVIAEKEKDYVEASRALGSSPMFILFRSLLPSIVGPIVVLISMSFAVAVMIEAGLSFLGMSAQPPMPSIGTMIAKGREYLYEAPHYSIFPGFALALLILSLNLIGDGLRDLFDPRRQRGG
jgi:peptide/nickel transport system permease protein